MILLSFDTEKRIVKVDLAGTQPRDLPGRLASFVMVASDCGVEGIICEGIGAPEDPYAEAVSSMIRFNPLFIGSMRHTEEAQPASGDFGYRLVSRNEDLLCLGDVSNNNMYSIFLSPGMEAAAGASVFAYMITNVLGFSSFMSFEVRFSVFELLSNIIKHGEAAESGQWIRVILERAGDKLSVTIIDKGTGNDPASDGQSGPGTQAAAGIFSGLGLAMTNRLTNLLSYEREQGTNRTYFEKSMVPGGGEDRNDRGVRMSKFRVNETDGKGTGVKRLILEGDLDSAGALALEESMRRLLMTAAETVEVDFERVSFVSSAGVGILLGMVSSLRSDGKDVVFLKVSSKIVSVFRLLNLEEYFGLTGAGRTAPVAG